jgi:LmbE family N-acetylglucosaminyl deacetylase
LKKQIIVFAPHPDDETLGCGGTIAKRISEGYDVVVIVLTDGRYAFSVVLGIDSDPTPEELKQMRKEEVIRATRLLGVLRQNVFFLDFEDGTLSRHEKDAEAKIIDIMKEFTPEEVYFTSAKDYNPDHQAASRIVRRCVQKLELGSIKYQYSIARKYARVGPVIDAVINLFRKTIVEIDVSKFVDLKKKALEEFKSEMTLISSQQKRPLTQDVDRFLTGKELFYLDR